jgi:hypothetical protein
MATMKSAQNKSTMHGGNGQATGKHVSGHVKGRKAQEEKEWEKLDTRGHPQQFDPDSKDDEGQAG